MAFTNDHLSFSRLSRYEQCPLAAMLHADVEPLAERTFSPRFSSRASKEVSS